MKVQDVISALDQFAPLPLQEGFDNAGLQIGLTEAEVSGALLCIDVTEETIAEAKRRGLNLIVSHHPLLFHPLRSITGVDHVQRIAMQAVREGVAVCSWHTNIDCARGGVNFKMAEKLGLENVRFIGGLKQCGEVQGAPGVVGEFAGPMGQEAFVALLKKAFGAAVVQTNALTGRIVKSVALCGGSGGFMLGPAAEAGADAFVTGEMHYHEFFGRDGQILIAAIGHYESERHTTEIFRDIITAACPGLECHTMETNPVTYHT